MEATKELLVNFLVTGRQYHCPSFPRGFRWEIKHCDALYEAIMKTGKAAVGNPAGRKTYFLGPLLYMELPDSHPWVANYQVLKGKQRLIATMLFLKALSDEAGQHPSVLEGVPALLLDSVYTSQPQGIRHRVVPRENERETYCSLIRGNATAADMRSRMGSALSYFRSRLANLDTKDLDTLTTGFYNLSIFAVKLDPKTDEVSDVVENFSDYTPQSMDVAAISY